jgi:hypothetical protein
MRVVIVGRSKKLIASESGLYTAMKRLGHQVILVDDRKLRQRIGSKAGTNWLLARVAVFRPDRVIFFKSHDVEIFGYQRIAEKTSTTMWYRDLTPPPDRDLDRIIERAAYLNEVFLTAGDQGPVWEAGGVKKTLWLPNAADRDLDVPRPADPRFACDIAFMGRGVSPGEDLTRAEFLVELSKKYHVRVWGQNWGRWAKELNWDGTAAYGADFARVCASAKIVVDIQPQLWVQANYDRTYSSNRMVKVMAVGGFCLGQGGPILQTLFREGEHCGWYQSVEEGYAQVEKYLSNDRLREEARQCGQAFVRAHHMMENRVHNLLTGEAYVNPLEGGR